ncbi:hypothetical protein SAMN05428642_104188 [Flaviramulus basaltis]|uniref:Uncharacterized protein n=1 Tax=Flaviramulus basaltis TaxID=369401 RepID=A0A1K2IQB7_9FLAO|nr:hypothetical protein [Flaviramulus basaltis]SFZ94450.1 hypothetical protein SAMN05428642_104188 [Flaviramulus basaltis]
MKKPYAVINFTKLEFEKIENTPPDFLDSNYLKYLVHHVLKNLAFHIEQAKREDEKEMEDITTIYIPLYSQARINERIHAKHKNFLCGNYIDHKKTRTTIQKRSILYQGEYVAWDNQNKGKPFSYRPSDIYKNKPICVDYIDDIKLSKKIRELEVKIHPVVYSGKYKFLKKYFVFEPRKPNLLEINLENAIELCQTRRKLHNNYGKYLNEASQIVDIYNGLFRIYYNKNTDGRLHTNLTRLPRVYRKHLKYNNKTLVEVDLSNSIVFFLAVLLRRSLPLNIVTKYPILLMIYKYLESIDIIEIQEFEKLSISGEIYDFFIPAFRENYKPNIIAKLYKKISDEPYEDRDEQIRKLVKKRLLAMLFSETKDYTIEQKIFSNKFPEILENLNNYKNENGYNKLSHALFQLEAFCMIDKAGGKFNKAYSKVAPLFTLHDCLITTLGYEKDLKETMEKAFIETLGVTPNMKIKVWE